MKISNLINALKLLESKEASGNFFCGYNECYSEDYRHTKFTKKEKIMLGHYGMTVTKTGIVVFGG